MRLVATPVLLFVGDTLLLACCWLLHVCSGMVQQLLGGCEAGTCGAAWKEQCPQLVAAVGDAAAGLLLLTSCSWSASSVPRMRIARPAGRWHAAA